MSPNPVRFRHVAAVPYPGRGHVNPMMNLCRSLIASNNHLVISCFVTEEWARLITTSDSDPPPPASFKLVTIPNCIPSEIDRSKDFAGFLDAVYTKMEGPFEKALEGLQPRVEAILADAYLPWAVAVGSRWNIPVSYLFTMSASFFSALYFFERLPAAVREKHVTVGRSTAAGEADEPLGKYIPGHNLMRISDIRSLWTTGHLKRALEAFAMVRKAQCILFTSFYELEAQVIDALREDLHCPVYPVGPSIPCMMLQEKPTSTPNSGNIDYIGWLSLQPKHSVLYVSLGSFLSVSAAQMDEIAMGLSLSGVRFLWVARGDSLRLQEIVGGMGIVVPWCHQLRVLSHPSVGGFLTHCGWNSTIEAIYFGVPMLAFPIFWDQPVDSRLIVDELKVGLNLRGEVDRDGVVAREDIALTVTRLMDMDGTESKEMRRRAAELRDSACQATGPDGSSSKNLDSFVKGLMLGSNC